ncbi:hypothetical protein OH76DRAFT_1377341 [Lentinus brumalis]|uniref:Fungal-type protein kinase domain-containing protein n=1 Tax=Lentinus brumalis TaxID=2498619 RepID=A0A371DJ37_9APHY|nr:hypothetical protein OH76DRAFT_1377341 [Polyporus brumalis]
MKLRTNACKYKNPGKVAVVNPSSRSPSMSSYEPPRTPPRAPQAGETDGDSSGPSTAGVSGGFPQAARNTVEPNFLENHFNKPPDISVACDIEANLEAIRNAQDEFCMYKPAGEALTTISKRFFDRIDDQMKENLLKRHKYLNGKLDSPLTFIDHHRHAPTNFPSGVLCDVKDAPDLLAVFKPADFVQKTEGDYKGVPHHRVVSVVEAKSKTGQGGRAQAASYTYRHQQARPDHPMVFALNFKPQWYQVILSSPNGVVASEETPWDDLDLLLAYVYAHYDPKDDHFLYDDTVSWNAPVGSSLPSWDITFKDTIYTGHFVFVGDPWGRRTTVFRASTGPSDDELIFKETYRHEGRRFKEEEVLEHIHAEGDIPGFVRLKDWEYVHTGGKPIKIGSGNDIRRKVRLALLDDGENLVEAKSVNDLLKAFYDVLEVHRTVYSERRVLHRDMSMHNILMYPRWATVKGRRVFKDAPPFIQDVLDGSIRRLEDRTTECLILDADNSAILGKSPVDKHTVLANRTGTPMYIARSVCIGRPQATYLYSITGVRMPTLTPAAERLYVKAYGQQRYDKFAEKNASTCHGAIPPLKRPNPPPPFVHRPCHDAESIFWTMFAALLLAQPANAERESHASALVATLWKTLYGHQIPEQPAQYRDDRVTILMMDEQEWEMCFHTQMRDVAVLLADISRQITPEYEYWVPRPPDDHLHEAIQRLILQYLVDHLDKDILLDPNHQRPTEPQTDKDKHRTDSRPAETRANGSRGSRSGRRGKGSRSSAQRLSKPKTSVTRTSGSQAPVVAGPSSGSRVGSRTSTTSRSRGPVVVDPKRRSGSQGGRSSKRLKGLEGSPVSINEEDEEH